MRRDSQGVEGVTPPNSRAGSEILGGNWTSARLRERAASLGSIDVTEREWEQRRDIRRRKTLM
jgi:hypothetical protein